MPRSIVEYFGEQLGSGCGYCKRSNGSNSHGMWAHQLTVQDYQDLIDRGWRRSGRYCYKPTMDTTCCPLYTIKCSALDVKLTKSQRKIIKKVNKFLTNGSKERPNNHSGDQASLEEHDGSCERNISAPFQPTSKPKFEGMDSDTNEETSVSTFNRKIVDNKSMELVEDGSNLHFTAKEESPKHVKNVSMSPICKKGVGVDLNKPVCKKAKVIRMERKKAKMAAKGVELSESQPNLNTEKSLEELLNDVPQKALHNLQIRLVRSEDVSLAQDGEPLRVYQKYQTKIHGDPIEKVSVLQFDRFLVKSPLQCELVPVKSEQFILTKTMSWQLFSKYQMKIHREEEHECNMTTYVDFLCDSPIKPWQDYGSFHQQYYLDGRLIAVGVIDVLPTCISSVYFYYDPDYSHLSLGTYGSLREIALVRNMHTRYPNVINYYMGFYVNNCPKMRYKARLMPSLLLCPETYTWHSIERCLSKIEASPYTRLSESPDDKDVDNVDENRLNNVLILFSERGLPYNFYQAIVNNSEKDLILEYANLIGYTCSQRILLYRSS